MPCACASTVAGTGRVARPIVQPGRIVDEAQGRQTGEMDVAAAPVEPDGEAAGVARQPERPLVGAGHDVAEVVLPVRGVAP